MNHHSFDTDGTFTAARRNSYGLNATNSLIQRVSMYELQNDVTPVVGSLPTAYSLSSASAYDRNAMATALKFKTNASGISY
jgi:hypothetical protein